MNGYYITSRKHPEGSMTQWGPDFETEAAAIAFVSANPTYSYQWHVKPAKTPRHC